MYSLYLFDSEMATTILAARYLLKMLLFIAVINVPRIVGQSIIPTMRCFIGSHEP